MNAEGQTGGPPPPPIARRPEGLFRAVRSWTLTDKDLADRAILNAGTEVDTSDPVFVRYPHLFMKVEER
jgi:hypothetical protein